MLLLALAMEFLLFLNLILKEITETHSSEDIWEVVLQKGLEIRELQPRCQIQPTVYFMQPWAKNSGGGNCVLLVHFKAIVEKIKKMNIL